MSTFVAAEAESLLGALLPFFRGQFLVEFDHVNVYGVRVLGHSEGRGKRLESLGRPSASLSDLLGVILLVLEVGGFRVPVIDFIWDCIKGHNLLHKQGGDSSSKEAD